MDAPTFNVSIKESYYVQYYCKHCVIFYWAIDDGSISVTNGIADYVDSKLCVIRVGTYGDIWWATNIL